MIAGSNNRLKGSRDVSVGEPKMGSDSRTICSIVVRRVQPTFATYKTCSPPKKRGVEASAVSLFMRYTKLRVQLAAVACTGRRK
jgi:hypothetical protein